VCKQPHIHITNNFCTSHSVRLNAIYTVTVITET